jgi:hypothetical protein
MLCYKTKGRRGRENSKRKHIQAPLLHADIKQHIKCVQDY